jgi:hypothetical protein
MIPNHPKFKGVSGFLSGLFKMNSIFLFGRFAGGKVIRPWLEVKGWLTPRFREQLCLVVTINNHCVG